MVIELSVKVTKKLIKTGNPNCKFSCPIGEAILNSGADHVAIRLDHFSVGYQDSIYAGDLPNEIQEWQNEAIKFWNAEYVHTNEINYLLEEEEEDWEAIYDPDWREKLKEFEFILKLQDKEAFIQEIKFIEDPVVKATEVLRDLRVSQPWVSVTGDLVLENNL